MKCQKRRTIQPYMNVLKLWGGIPLKNANHRFTDQKDAQSVSRGSAGFKLKSRQQYKTTHKPCSCVVDDIIPQGTQCPVQTI